VACILALLFVGFISQAQDVRANAANEAIMQHVNKQLVGTQIPERMQNTLDQAVQQAKESLAQAQSAYLTKLEAEEALRAAEEAARQAEEARQVEEARQAAEAERVAQEAAAQAAQAVPASASEQALLAAIIFCEAGNQPYDGQVAVGAVIVNRMKSGAYPNSMADVIYQPGQFGPAMSGWLDSVLASGGYTDTAMQAAVDALNGSNPIGDCLSFGNGNYGIQIGDHFFH